MYIYQKFNVRELSAQCHNSVLNVKALVGAYSVIVKLLVIFGNLRFKLYYLFLFLPRSQTVCHHYLVPFSLPWCEFVQEGYQTARSTLLK